VTPKYRPFSAPNWSGLKPRVKMTYIGRTAVIISEEMSVTRLTEPSASTLGATAARVRADGAPASAEPTEPAETTETTGPEGFRRVEEMYMSVLSEP
jgi:hypothetical protein